MTRQNRSQVNTRKSFDWSLEREAAHSHSINHKISQCVAKPGAIHSYIAYWVSRALLLTLEWYPMSVPASPAEPRPRGPPQLQLQQQQQQPSTASARASFSTSPPSIVSQTKHRAQAPYPSNLRRRGLLSDSDRVAGHTRITWWVVVGVGYPLQTVSGCDSEFAIGTTREVECFRPLEGVRTSLRCVGSLTAVVLPVEWHRTSSRRPTTSGKRWVWFPVSISYAVSLFWIRFPRLDWFRVDSKADDEGRLSVVSSVT